MPSNNMRRKPPTSSHFEEELSREEETRAAPSIDNVVFLSEDNTNTVCCLSLSIHYRNSTNVKDDKEGELAQRVILACRVRVGFPFQPDINSS